MGRPKKEKYKNPEEIKSEALKLIEEDEKIVFIYDLYTALGIPCASFYSLFPKESEDYKELTDKIEGNKIKMKMKIRDRLMECKNPGAYIFLYKILTSDIEERKLMDAHYPEDHIEENKVINLKIK